MKALKLLCLSLVTLAAFSACNHESPVNVAGQEYSIKVEVVKNKDNASLLDYNIYVPAIESWCGKPPGDSLSPWFWRSDWGIMQKVNFSDIQSAKPGYEDYYRLTVTLNKEDRRQLILTYGNYQDLNNSSNVSKAQLQGKASQYILKYQPTDKREDDEYIIGMYLHDGRADVLDNNVLLPIRATIHVDGTPRIGQQTRFAVNNLEYTNLIGIKSFVWIFNSGFERYGEEIYETFYASGSNSVTLVITDKLGKQFKLQQDFNVSN